MIATAAELLLDDPTVVGVARERVERIARAGRRTGAVVEALLFLGRDDSLSAPVIVDLQTVVNDTVEVYLPLARAKGLDLLVECSGEQLITAPPGTASIVLQNLVENAIRFTDHGSVRVLLEPGRLAVEDTGVGLAGVGRQRIFERGYRSDASARSGLGLDLIRRVCDRVGCWAWADEPAAWQYSEAWDQLLFGLRLGQRPRVVATTTPKPITVIREILARPDTVITRSRTADNIAHLAPVFLTTVVSRYEGTRLGRQELEGELLEDVPGALWTRSLIDAHRWPAHRPLPALERVVVGIDPAATSTEGADETGLVVAGVGVCTCTGQPARHGFILKDASARAKPIEWARAAIGALRTHGGDRLIAEVNNGGEMVEATIRMVDPNAPYRAVHASRGKAKRAEPISALYEQGKAHHVGTFNALEDQMCNWVPDLAASQASPDRMDALVWAMTDLMVTSAEFYVV